MRRKSLVICWCLCLAFLLASCNIKKETVKFIEPVGLLSMDGDSKEEGIVEKVMDTDYIIAETLPYYDKINTLIESQENDEMGCPIVDKDIYVDDDSRKGDNLVLHKNRKCMVDLNYSIGYPLVEICSKMNASPFSCFNTLKKENVITEIFREEEMSENGLEFDSGIFARPSRYRLNSLYVTPIQKEYSYTKEGAKEFLANLCALSQTNRGNLDILDFVDVEMADAGMLEKEPTEIIQYSEADDCYYSFIMQYDINCAYIMGLYFRSDNNEVITDVTFQFLTIVYPITDCSMGISICMEEYRETVRFEVLSIITAIEKCLTQDCYMQQNPQIPVARGGECYNVPSEYQIGSYRVNLKMQKYCSAIIPEEYCEEFVAYTYNIHLEE